MWKHSHQCDTRTGTELIVSHCPGLGPYTGPGFGLAQCEWAIATVGISRNVNTCIAFLTCWTLALWRLSFFAKAILFFLLTIMSMVCISLLSNAWTSSSDTFLFDNKMTLSLINVFTISRPNWVAYSVSYFLFSLQGWWKRSKLLKYGKL